MRLNLSKGLEAYPLFPKADRGVVLHCRPATSEVIERAKADAALKELATGIRTDMGLAEGEQLDLEASVTPEMMASQGAFSVLFAKAIARQVIERWEEVEDPDGSPAPVQADRIDALLDLSPIFDAFTSVYLSKWLMLSAEKNDSAPSQTGTSAAAQTTATPAQGDATSARKKPTSR